MGIYEIINECIIQPCKTV